ncbi:MAG: hypothetical protein QG608_3302 [Actinomycetota bacterium]|nr:hypothetical protein [Actinomycetota bacterium]
MRARQWWARTLRAGRNDRGRSCPRFRLTASAAALATAAAGLAYISTVPQAHAAAAGPGDGKTSQRAGASCWGIKSQYSSSATGVYWLISPNLVAPQQFYCDMTTDGGGWVLVGRGRENWNWRDSGQAAAATVSGVPTGTKAFTPAALPAETVNGLLHGSRLDALSDGIRVRRALNSSGSSWQEIRYYPASAPRWTWAIGGGFSLKKAVVGGTTITGGNSYDVNADGKDGEKRVVTWPFQERTGWQSGFAYGGKKSGASSSTNSFLWQSSKNEGYPIGFAQVWLRPKLPNSRASAGTAIPAKGLAASTITPMLAGATSDLNGWGVTGLDAGTSPIANFKSNVTALAEYNGKVYVGGMFTTVAKNGTAQASQPYLAAFDRKTGAWDSTFRPKLDGGVWDIVPTPSGNLLIGGMFSKVNGAAKPALALISPKNGSTVTGWTSSLTYDIDNGARLGVRSMDLVGDWLYLGGNITVVSGGTGTSKVTVRGRNLFRLRLSDGRPDPNFRPQLSTSPIQVYTSRKGDRVYAAGKFGTVNGQSVEITAVFNPTNGQLISGLQPVKASYDCRPNCGNTTYAPYAETLLETSDSQRVVVGPTEHALQFLKRDLSRVTGHITRKGGDFQTILQRGSQIYASGHGWNYNFSQAATYKSSVIPPPVFAEVSSFHGTAAYNSTTGEKLLGFDPVYESDRGDGVWQSMLDTSQCLWLGGDVVRGSWRGSGYAWAGGFVRFCGRDITAPTQPKNLKAVKGSSGPVLSWTGSTDTGGAVSYEILRNDRVIASTTSTTWTDSSRTEAGTYFVRAVDYLKNRSATTAVVTWKP